jgi:Rieske Fe-S protein
LPDGIGKKGVYRDLDGQLHAVSLRCTHLGCLVRFNAAEHSWDCPCHGSRFAPDGAVLEGPAVKALERRNP